MKQLGQEPPSLHSPLYYPDAEESLVTGVHDHGRRDAGAAEEVTSWSLAATCAVVWLD